MSRVVHVRGWPGLDDWKPSDPVMGFRDRLFDRNGLVLFAASERRAGGPVLLIAIEIVGRSIIAGWLVVADDLRRRDRNAHCRLAGWAARHRLDTTTGPRPWRLLTIAEFFDSRRGVFARVAYTGCGFVIGADLGRLFGLVAEHVGGRRGKNAGSWEVWLPGWGRRGGDGRWRRASPHRPALYVTARRAGWEVRFGPCGKGDDGSPLGKRVRGRLWRGAFLDVVPLAYALDGERGASFAEHCELAGVPGIDLPVSVGLDAGGADRLAVAVETIRQLALALDVRAAQWFTTPDEVAEGRGRVDLCKTVSPGSLAQEVLGRFRVEAPLSKFDLSPEEHLAWAETFHGGWCEAVR